MRDYDVLKLPPDGTSLYKAMYDVAQFHEKFGLPVEINPAIPEEKQRRLRMDLITEEFEEVYEAWKQDDLTNLTQELADLIYVCIGMALTYGLPLDYAFEEIHRANMRKVGGGSAENGKIMKPEGFEPADVQRIMDACDES